MAWSRKKKVGWPLEDKVKFLVLVWDWLTSLDKKVQAGGRGFLKVYKQLELGTSITSGASKELRRKELMLTSFSSSWMMSGMWEGGCEKEGVLMVKARNFGNHEEARRMKVGGYNIMNQLASQGVVKSTFVEEWRQDLQVMAIVAMHGEEFMSMVSGRWLAEVEQRYLDLLK